MTTSIISIQSEVVATFVKGARQLNSDITYICDPDIEDANLGIFVADQL